MAFHPDWISFVLPGEVECRDHLHEHDVVYVTVTARVLEYVNVMLLVVEVRTAVKAVRILGIPGSHLPAT